MNKLIFSAIFFAISFLVISCDDDEPIVVDYSYHAHIHSPTTDVKHVDDSVHIHIAFESHTGEAVHHVNVQIYNKEDSTIIIYNKPDVAHVHATTGAFELHDDFVLSNTNGVTAHTNWIVQAKVWGEEAGEGEVIETIEFHVHP